MRVRIDPKVRVDFPNLNILSAIVRGMSIRGENPELEALKDRAMRDVRAKYNVDSLKDVPSIRAYRNFLWRIGIDPTKNRPASEALIRRVLLGGSLPKINTFVDSLNLSSMLSEVAIASFDLDRVMGEPILRYAVRGESFYGIGMDKPLILEGNELIISDDGGVIAIYPYRDSERTKITERTRDALLVFCGVPGISLEMLREAMDMAVKIITRFCGGLAITLEAEKY